MATTEIFLREETSSKRTSGVFAWPAKDAIFFQIDDALFTSGTEEIIVTIELSWDGGNTFPVKDETRWVGGVKSAGGASPAVRLGPYRRGNQVQNPTHVRFSMEPGRGTPTIGLVAEVG